MTAVIEDLLCLGVPALVLDVSADGLVAIVDCFGARHPVRLELVDSRVSPGDYVLNHVGYAIRRIPDDDIAETLACYEQLLRGMSEGDDDLPGQGSDDEDDGAAGGDLDD